MNGYLLYPAAALLVMTLFVIAVGAASIIIKFSEKVRNKRKKFFVAGKYNSYYKTDKDILNDERAKRMLSVIARGYKQDLEDYMFRISEDRLPPCIVMNWVRSVSEDLSQAAIPVVNIKKWHHNMILLSSDESVATKADSIDMKNYEECFIWGCIVRWLELFEKDILDDELKNEIFQVACPKRYLKPYYNITFMTQEEKVKIAEAIMKSGNVRIGQISIGDNNTLNYNATSKDVQKAGFTDEQVARAIAEISGEGKPLSLMKHYVGVICALQSMGWPQKFATCCTRINQLPGHESYPVRCDSNAIKSTQALKFASVDYKEWGTYKPKPGEEAAVFKECKFAADSFVEVLMAAAE